MQVLHMYNQKKFRLKLGVACRTLIVAAAVLGAGCSNTDKPEKQTKILYSAVKLNDTARLKLEFGEKAFDGQLEISYKGLYKDSGSVNGIIKGDTLKGTYYFQRYGIPKWERIPISLLKKDSKLIMGVGTMEIYMNMTFFKKTIPIDYQNVKFIFEKVR